MDVSWRRVQSWVLSLLFFIVVVEVILIAPKSLNEPKPISTKVEPDLDLQQSMTGIHVMETRNESQDWELWAEKALGFRATGDMELQTVKAVFFSADGSTFTVTGKTGAVDATSKNMRVTGDVITKSSNGYTFQTDNVVYDSETKTLNSDSFVSVKGPKEAGGNYLQIAGNGMKTELAAGTISILSSVKANKALPQTGNIAIESQSAEFNSKDKAMHFSGGVTLDFAGVRVKGPDAKFLYDSKQDLLKEIELEGGVRVSDWNKWATSDRVKINLQENKYIFNGRPRVVQDEDELQGDEIIFLNGGKKVKVKNARIKVGKDQLEKIK